MSKGDRVIEMRDADNMVLGMATLPRGLHVNPPVLWHGDLYQPTGEHNGNIGHPDGPPIMVYRRAFMFRILTKGDG
jgi:hypothetical protein